MNTRPAVLEDATAIATAHVRSWQAAYAHLLSAEFLSGLSIQQRAWGWAEALGKRESEIFVAEENGVVQAFVSFGRCRDKRVPEDRGEILALYATPGVWGKGMGRALLGLALQRLRQHGYKSTSLWVLCGNQRGIRFYVASGFSAVPGSEQTVTLGGEQVEEVQLLCHLAA